MHWQPEPRQKHHQKQQQEQQQQEQEQQQQQQFFCGEIKARPIDIISFSLGYLSKSTRTDKQYRQATLH